MTRSPRRDPELVELARAGSPEALGELYARHGNAVMAVAYRLTGSAADAEDVVHDVFLGLPEGLARYEERGTFESWLRQLAARVALTRLRSVSRQREVPLGQLPLIANAPSAESLGDRVALAAAVASLPPALRVVFVLKVIEGYPHARIAEILDISVGASEVRLVRAIKTLRRTLGGSR
ncbi:MAG: sigma-70 family RNA polymerase sigma factor [Gemmatimonadota bacterium]|nr:sigma-70 family RNA polymerase sigma factor [Gemmatimonadota bacterium]